MLRQWKSEQIADYDKIQQGWSIDDQMADDVAAASFSNVEIAIVRSNIYLGGEGGKAPGAGGGGGGAIGKNARAGVGGDGGNIRIDEGEFSIPLALDEMLSRLAELRDDSTAGSGGGGGGAVGDNSRGGNGGGGGELVAGAFDVAALNNAGFDRIEIEIGSGGVGASSTDQDGAIGQDTVLRFVAKDGTTLRTMRARGGIGGSANEAAAPESEPKPSMVEIEQPVHDNRGIDDSMSAPAWKLEDDGKTVTVIFPTNPPVALRLDATGVEDILKNLGEFRALMSPQVPMDFVMGQKVGAIADPVWRSEPDMLQGHSLLHLREPRFGWLHFLLPPHEAQALGHVLLKQAEAQSTVSVPDKAN